MNRAAPREPGIAECDAGVAQQAAPLGSFDGTSAKELAKIRLAKSQKPFRPGKQKRIVPRRWRCSGCVFLERRKNSWLELRDCGNGSAVIPRADVLTDVTPKNMIAHRPAIPLGNGIAQFDGQIRNTLLGIHDIRLDKGLCRTSVETTPTASTQIRRRQFSGAERRLEIQRRENYTEKKERANRLVEQQSIFS